MALLYIDGFEHKSALGRYTNTDPAFFTPGRLGGVCLRPVSDTGRSLTPAKAYVYTGFGLKCDGSGIFLRMFGPNFVYLQFERDISGTVSVYYRNRDLLLGTSTSAPIPTGSFVYVEVYGRLDSVAGRAVVRVNGQTVIDFTGNTSGGTANVLIDAVILNPGAQTYFDDWYVSDDTGGAPFNSFLGDVRVDTLMPVGVGATTGLTPTPAGANYTNVDETPVSAADYNGSAVIGAKDTYTLGDLPAGVRTVLAVQHSWYAFKSDAGVGNARPVVRSGAVDYPGPQVALPTSQTFQQDLRTSDPATAAAWTVAEVNALETGMEVV